MLLTLAVVLPTPHDYSGTFQGGYSARLTALRKALKGTGNKLKRAVVMLMIVTCALSLSHTHTRTHTNTRTHAHTHTRTHTHTHTRTHIHTHMHARTHTHTERVCVPVRSHAIDPGHAGGRACEREDDSGLPSSLHRNSFCHGHEHRRCLQVASIHWLSTSSSHQEAAQLSRELSQVLHEHFFHASPVITNHGYKTH